MIQSTYHKCLLIYFVNIKFLNHFDNSYIEYHMEFQGTQENIHSK